MAKPKLILLGRYEGSDGELEPWFTLIGVSSDTCSAVVRATATGDDRVRISVTIRTTGEPPVDVKIENFHASIGAFQAGTNEADSFQRVGRAPLMHTMNGDGSSVTFDVLPGYIARQPVDKVEFTFVVVGDLELDSSVEATDPGETSSLLPAPDRGALAGGEGSGFIGRARPEVTAVVELDADGTRRSVECSHPDYTVDAYGERVADDPRNGRPRLRVVLGGLADLRPDVEVCAIDASGLATSDRVEVAPGSLEYNALTVLGARDSAGKALGLRLTVRGEARHRRGGLA